MGIVVTPVGKNNYRVSKDALDDDGYVLNLIGTAGADQGKVQKTASSNLRTYGVGETNTKDQDGTAQAGVEVAIVREGIAKVKLSTTNAALIPGDMLIAIAGGLADKYTPTTIDNASAATVTTTVTARFQEISHLVGRCEDVVAQNTGGKARVRLQIVSVTNGQNG